MATRFRLNFEQIFGTSAQVLAGGTLTFCISHGAPDQLQAIYSDDALTVTKLNPVTLDSAGKHGDIFLQPKDYRVILKDAAGIVQPGGDVDPVHGGPAGAQPINVFDFGVVGDGVADDTAAILAAEAARLAGQTLKFPGGKIYKITAPLGIAKPGIWDIKGATFNSAAGNVNISSSDVMIDGYGAVFNFASGDPAQALDRAIRATGALSTAFGMTGSVASAGTSFVASAPGDAAALSVGGWTMVVEIPHAGQWSRIEIKQVLSIAGATVNLTSPYRRAIGVVYPPAWYKMTPLENVVIQGLTVNTTNTVDDNVAVDCQIVRTLTIKDCIFDVAKGMAWQVFIADNCRVLDNKVLRQGGRKSGISTCQDSTIARNRFQAKDAPTDGALTIETGCINNVFDSNVVDKAVGGAGAFFCNSADACVFVNNSVIGDATVIGLYINGGDGNIESNNKWLNLGEGVRLINDTGMTPTRSCDYNTSDWSIFRNCNYGVTITGGSGNAVNFHTDNGTVVTRVQDAGSGTGFRSGPITQPFTPTIVASVMGDLAVTYTLQHGRAMFDGRFEEIQLNVEATINYTTASGPLYVSIIGSPNLQTVPLSGVVVGWSHAGISGVIPVANASDPRLTFALVGSGIPAPYQYLQITDVPSGGHVTIYVHGRFEIAVP